MRPPAAAPGLRLALALGLLCAAPAGARRGRAVDDPTTETREECDDDVDNDGDGLVDCADPDCHVGVVGRRLCPPAPAPPPPHIESLDITPPPPRPPPGPPPLAADDVCYRFCEDSSLPFVARRDDCPAGTTCRTTLPPGMAAFDSCHTPETCQRDGASGAPPTPPPPPPASGKPHKRHMGGECNPALAEAQIGRVDQMCCQDGAQCPGGIPQSCNLECAAVFLPLYSDCPDLLAMHPNLQPHWDALADTCEHAMASAIASNTDGGEAAFLVVEVDDGNSAQPPTVMVAMAEMPAPVADDGRGHRWPPAPTAPGCGRADALPWVMCSPQSPSDEFCSTHCYRGLAEFLERCSDTLSSDVEAYLSTSAGPESVAHCVEMTGKAPRAAPVVETMCDMAALTAACTDADDMAGSGVCESPCAREMLQCADDARLADQQAVIAQLRARCTEPSGGATGDEGQCAALVGDTARLGALNAACCGATGCDDVSALPPRCSDACSREFAGFYGACVGTDMLGDLESQQPDFAAEVAHFTELCVRGDAGGH